MSALISVLVTIAVPAAALAESGDIKLALLPVGQAGSFFDVTMRPGDTRRFEVAIANNGIGSLAARTYAADVYTIINGGFGGSLRDAPRTGMTQWLDYPTGVLQLSAGESIHRSFTVSVPDDVGPGEYISSILLENDRPLPGGGAVGLDQIIRQAIAVVVTIPGERKAALEIGETNHKVVAGRSIVAVAVENPGNIRLKPVVSVVLLDATGSRMSEAIVPMDTFYSHTATFIEVPLDALLMPGTYTAQVGLNEAVEGLRVETTTGFVVEAPPPGPTTAAGDVPLLGQVFRAADEGQVPVMVLAVVLVAGLVLAWLIVIMRRRRQARVALR